MSASDSRSPAGGNRRPRDRWPRWPRARILEAVVSIAIALLIYWLLQPLEPQLRAAGTVAVLLFALCTLVLPEYFVKRDARLLDSASLSCEEHLKAVNSVRTTLLQGLAGLLLLATVAATWLQVQNNRQTDLTERYARAAEQLGSRNREHQSLRTFAVYALERLAKDSPDYAADITELLTSFVRRTTPPLEGPSLCEKHGKKNLALLDSRAPDVQTAIQAIRHLAADPALAPRKPINLGHADLRRVVIREPNLTVDFHNARFVASELCWGDLKGVNLRKANLNKAILIGAHLQDADLTGANLEDTDLRGACLNRTKLDAASLKNAIADNTTEWPKGFNARTAGVIIQPAKPFTKRFTDCAGRPTR